MAFIRKVKDGNMATYANIITDVVRSMSTNMNAEEAIKIFKVFSEKQNWSIVNTSMPAQTYEIGPMVMVKPRYNEIKRFYQ